MSKLGHEHTCDCCGAKIPYKSEYNRYSSPIDSGYANNSGNKQFANHRSLDMIHGMVVFNIRREPETQWKETTPNQGFDEARMQDICPECKIKFLKRAIDYIQHHDINNDYNKLFDNLNDLNND